MQVPGFRQGKAVPEQMLMNYVGREKVISEAVETLLLDNMKYALREVEGRSIKDSEKLTTTKEELLSMMKQVEKDKLASLEFSVEVEVAPTLTWKSSYHDLILDVTLPHGEKNANKKTEAVISSRLRDLGTLRIVTDRGFQMGDNISVNTEAYKLNEDGTKGDEILTCRQERFRIDTNDESIKDFIPGFVDGIIGAKSGDVIEGLHLTFPENWAIDSLQNVKSEWKITVLEHLFMEVPEESDELADKIQPGMKTMKELREHLNATALKSIEKEAEQKSDEAMLQAVTELVDVDVPETLVQDQGYQMYMQKLMELKQSGRVSPDQITQFAQREMVDNFVTSMRDDIEKSVKLTLAVENIFESEESLSITREELETEVKTTIEEFERDNFPYEEKKLEEQAEEVLIGRKVMQFLRDTCTINKTYSFDE